MALIKCKECSKDISSEAASCPNCGVAIKKAKKKTGVIAKIFIVIGCLFFGLIVLSYIVEPHDHDRASSSSTSNTSTESSSDDAPPSKPIVNINVVRLANEYDANEVATDEKYKNSILHIHGIVESIDKDFTDSVVIHLALDNQYLSAGMSMNDDQKSMAAQLQRGATVAVECKRITRILKSPTGSHCHFV